MGSPTRAKFVPVRRTMSTIGIGSPSTRSGPTAGGIFQSKGSPKRPTGTSSNAGLGITASTSSRVWPQNSRLLRSSKRSWSESYENLVDSDTRVDVNTGIVAPGRLQSLIDSRDCSHDLLVMKVQMDQICDAVKSTLR